MHRIFVQPTIPDARAKVKKKQFQALGLKNKLGQVYLADCYTIDARLDKNQIQKSESLLANPLVESADTALRAPRFFNYIIEIGFLPGVTDNVGHTAKETLADGAKVKFKSDQHVYSSQIYFLDGKLSENEIQKITNSLYNPLIQRARLTPFSPLAPINLPFVIPKVKLTASTKVSLVDLNVSDEELTKLGKLGIKSSDDSRQGPLSLSLDYLITIREHFNKLKRKPTDVEIETLAQTWSEHCKHTIFADPMDELKNGIYKTYIKGATEKIRKQKSSNREGSPLRRGEPSTGDFCVSVFTDNAGGIIFDQDWIITHKVETHNTPSALDPFGGAITGIVGVNRDCIGFGLGAKPIINTYGFCFGNPDDERILYRSNPVGEGLKPSPTEGKNKMLSPKRIMQGVIAGINAGGNQSGIPTNSGFVYFDKRYRGKPLVFAGTVGLIPKTINKKPSWIKQQQPGDFIVMVGGRVGADGIHGATFSSETLDSHSPATAVQIGDPITQKKMSDALVEARRGVPLYSSITDCGAGGLSSAVGEMAQATNGCLVNLEKVPLKYPGLAPWQIWISESQERMVLAVRPNKWKILNQLLKKRGVEATVIGKFTADSKCVVKFKNHVVLNLDMDFLHNGRPIKQQHTKKPKAFLPERSEAKSKDLLKINLTSSILNLLSSPNLTSTEFITTQYDHEVQAGSVLKPLQGAGRINAEATVTRPLLNSQKGIVLSYGLNPSYSELDPYNMAACAIDSAIRSAVATGANVDYLALLDNFCWCSPEDPERLWQLKEAARACFDYATAYGTPFISGKDSMYNDFKGFSEDGKPIKISIPPTLLISAIGVIPDVTKSISLDAKLPGDVIYILGTTDNEMGGSEYSLSIFPSPRHGEGAPTKSGRERLVSGNVPQVNAKKNYALYKLLYNATQKNLLASSISISRGGLIIALLKKLMGGGLGADVNLKTLPGNWQENYQALFSESQGRILVTVDPNKATDFETHFKGQIFACLGKTTAHDKIIIKDKTNKEIVTLKTSDALKAYKSTFKDY